MTSGLTTTTFAYTGDGDRIAQATHGVTTTFTLDLNTALAQVLAAQGGGSQSFFLPGVGQQLNGDWLFPHGDALGSVRHVTSAAGELLGSMSYSPFGERVESTGVLPFLGFTGEPQQPASDLTYLRARYYHPALGRFLTVDSLVPDVSNGQAWNAYAYVYNDVLNLVDPSGFEGEPSTSAAGTFMNALSGGWLPAAYAAGSNLWRSGFHPFGCDCEEGSTGSSNLATAVSIVKDLKVEQYSRLFSPHASGVLFTQSRNKPWPILLRKLAERFPSRYRLPMHFNPYANRQVYQVLNRIGGLGGSALFGGAMQAFVDWFDCTTSLPEQLARAGIVAVESAALAFVLVNAPTFATGVGLYAFFAGAMYIANEPIFDAIDKRSLTPLFSHVSPVPTPSLP